MDLEIDEYQHQPLLDKMLFILTKEKQEPEFRGFLFVGLMD